MMKAEPLGRKIQKIRQTKAMPVKKLASKINISYNQASQIERGVSMPSFSVFVSILNALETNAEAVFQDISHKAALAVFADTYERCRLELNERDFTYLQAIIRTRLQLP